MPAEVTKIQDYAIIGNGRSVALISKRGSLDWLCWPRFDSQSVFGAILDSKNGGHWSIHPLHESEVSRRYIENTNVLETTFLRPSGQIVLTDFMAVTSEENKRRALWPEHELVRQIRCEHGKMEVVVEVSPRLDYGRVAPKIRDAGKFGWRIDTGANVFILRGNIALEPTPDGLAARFVLKSGESVVFTFSFSAEAPAVVPPLGRAIDEKLNLAIDWWRSWAAQSTYCGPYQRQVTRSALVLKLLSYAPSGTIIAAPTTSLPESIGGGLNWDYRFAWLRDASFTVHALFGLGYKNDAAAFVDWLLHATRLTRPKLRVMYDVFGNRRRLSVSCRIWSDTASRCRCAWATPQANKYNWMFMASWSKPCRISLVKPKNWTATCMECCAASANMFANTGAKATTAFGRSATNFGLTHIHD